MIPRYSRPELAALWDDKHRFELWLDGRARGLPRDGARRHRARRAPPTGSRAAAAGKLDPARILEIEATTRHDVIAFLTHVEELAGEPARWLHLGMTSSDVLDTALALQTGRALDQILDAIGKLAGRARRGARASTRATPMIGRSHGIHAEPITAGLTFARWYAEVARAAERVARAARTIAVGKIAGAVGVYGNLDPQIEAEALDELGLRRRPSRPRSSRAIATPRCCARSRLLGTAIEQIALGVRHWQRTEVGEAEEGFGAGQKGSSAMPHKKNPILSENLCGLARAAARRTPRPALEDVALWHERDISHSSVERVALPDATILADFMTARATSLVDGLVIHPSRMRANLDRTGGLYFSEAVLLALVKHRAGRASTPTRWSSARRSPRCRRPPPPARSARGRAGSASCSAPTPRSRRGSTPPQLDALFDLEHHLRHAPAILERALGSRPDGGLRWRTASAARDAALRAQLGPRSTSRRFARSAAARSTRYDGKVRDCLIDRARGERIIIVTDRLSAFDAVVGTIPFKGQVLNQLAQFWFDQHRSIAPNHMLRVPDPNVMVARECEPLPVELVMRAYLTGSDLDLDLEGLRGRRADVLRSRAARWACARTSRCRTPILTPSTKAAKGDHDVSVSRDELLAMGRISAGAVRPRRRARRRAVRRRPAPRRERAA